MKILLVLSLGLVLGGANSMTWEQWKADFYTQGLQAGISPALMSDFNARVQPYARAVASDQSQSEFKKFLWDYIDSAVSVSRVSNGRAKFAENNDLLVQISDATGVSPQYIVAIWGMESSFGNYQGKVPIIDSMATLAHEGRRKRFFEKELLTALQLIDSHDIASMSVKGSWAGGMGHTQFIPTTYRDYAVDFDGDGVRDLWSKVDALASTGNYLNKMGWQANHEWGQEVTVTSGFDYSQSNKRKDWRSIHEWQSIGVQSVVGKPLASGDTVARLLIPAGQYGPKFLLYKNFDVIKRYNNSDAYALGVSLLADKIVGKAGLQIAWPTNAKRLTKNDIKFIQQTLNEQQFNAGKVDGIFGNGTRLALQAYQKSSGLVADGFLSRQLFKTMVNE